MNLYDQVIMSKSLHESLLIHILLWGHIRPYPKDGLVQPKHILRA